MEGHPHLVENRQDSKEKTTLSVWCRLLSTSSSMPPGMSGNACLFHGSFVFSPGFNTSAAREEMTTRRRRSYHFPISYTFFILSPPSSPPWCARILITTLQVAIKMLELARALRLMNIPYKDTWFITSIYVMSSHCCLILHTGPTYWICVWLQPP